MRATGRKVAGLAELLKCRRLTQQKVADKLGIDSSIVSLWVTGRRAVPLEREQPLAEILNIDVRDLRNSEEPSVALLEPEPLPGFEIDAEWSPGCWDGRSQYSEHIQRLELYEWVCFQAGHTNGYCEMLPERARVIRAAVWKLSRCSICGSSLYLRDIEAGQIGGGIQHRPGHVPPSVMGAA